MRWYGFARRGPDRPGIFPMLGSLRSAFSLFPFLCFSGFARGFGRFAAPDEEFRIEGRERILATVWQRRGRFRRDAAGKAQILIKSFFNRGGERAAPLMKCILAADERRLTRIR